MVEVRDERKALIDDVVQCMMPYVSDISELESHLYIVLNKYEITSRCTELAEVHTDRNDFLLQRFLVAKTVKGCSKRTLNYYQKELVRILGFIDKTIDDITADDIRYYLAIRQRRDQVSKTTIGNERRILSSFFGWLQNEELLKRNPMLKVEVIKQDRSKKEALTELEIEKIRMAARGERERAIIEILLSTGCRVSELVNIAISDVDENRILVHGKGGKDRFVYMNARAELAYKMYMDLRKDNNPYVFPRMRNIGEVDKKGKKRGMHDWWKDAANVDEGHCDMGTIEQITRKLAKKAGVEQANPHKFRRTCATLALRRGMPIEQVSKMLGHEQISTTQIYLDLSEEDLVMAHKKYVV